MTDERERKKGELIDFMALAAMRGRKSSEPKPSVRVKGNGSIVGNHNSVQNDNSIHISIQPTPRQASARAPSLPIDPGGVHISDPEAVELSALVDKVIAASGKPGREVWTALNRHARVTTYRRIPRARFGECVTFMRRWLSQLGANGSGTVPELRSAIMEELQKRGLKESRAELLEQRYGVSSLRAINKAQMDDFLGFVRTLPL